MTLKGMLQWVYVKPCGLESTELTAEVLFQLGLHELLDGAPFWREKGITVNGKSIWPGSEPHCNCASRPF